MNFSANKYTKNLNFIIIFCFLEFTKKERIQQTPNSVWYYYKSTQPKNLMKIISLYTNSHIAHQQIKNFKKFEIK